MDDLTQYLRRVTRLLRLHICMNRAAATITVSAALTPGLAWWLTRLPGSPAILTLLRIVLFAATALSILSVIPPLLRINPKWVAHFVERKYPNFNQRLITFTERTQATSRDPFLPLLAEDAAEIARDAAPQKIVSHRALIGNAAVTAAGIVLLSLVLSSPGMIGHNAKALWGRTTLFSVETNSSRNTVRRRGVLITARLKGFNANRANLWTRASGNPVWTSAPMFFRDSDSEFALQIPDLSRDTEYYVESEGIHSPTARIKVMDLPAVKRIAVSYPTGTPGLNTEGDIVAPAGALARLQIETDRPMPAAQLTLDEGDPVHLPATEKNGTSASIPVLRDGAYHVSMLYNGELVQVSDDHAIEVMTRDNTKPHPRSLLEGVREAPVPAGYEQSVAEYYRRLSELQAAR